MLVPLKWLNEYVDIADISPKTIADDMTMSGSKAETVEFMGGEIENVVVGRILSVERHPDADKLVICSVEVGQSEPVQIVTGAKNVSAGDLVPVALHKSRLPGGVEIRSGKLRGVVSNGMLCSIKELGLTLHECPYAVEDGILILTEGGEPGEDIRKVLGLDDYCIEYEITPNRPDCLCMIGMAREAAATFGRELRLREPVPVKGEGDIRDYLSVTVKDTELCPRYSARVVKNVKIAPSPKWMRERLHSAGVRPINNIVDITNYVMLEYGQPMHSFDYACLSGKAIVVRRAAEGESMNTLDGKPRALRGDMLVIADSEKPVAVAGVMGGENSEITDGTVTVVFESANFSGPSVRKTSKVLGMRTDASARFEKGLDPAVCITALERACELVEQLGAGEVVAGRIDENCADTAPRKAPFRPERINARLGTDISREDMIGLLAPLGFTVCGDEVSIPSWRADVSVMADLAEEVARMYGYDNIPSTPFTAAADAAPLTEEQALVRRLAAACRGFGFDQALTFTFIGTKDYDNINLPADSEKRLSIALRNPLGEDTGLMRTTSLPSLLGAVATNASYRNPDAALYEVARVFLPVIENGRACQDKLPEERDVLTLAAYGEGQDFFALKGCVEGILAACGIRDAEFTAAGDEPSYHPGRCARVCAGGECIGVFGQIHPAVQKNYGIDREVYAAELSVAAILAAEKPETLYKAMPRHPAVMRDIAVTCARALPVAELEKAIRKGGAGLLEKLSLFDVYTGSQIPADQKSVAYALSLRAADRTLNESEIEACMKKILHNLEADCGAVIRK